MVVCHCKAVNDAAIRELIAAARLTPQQITAACGAGSDCGGCLATIEDLIEAAAGSPVGLRSGRAA